MRALLDRAARRRPSLPAAETDAYRLFDGVGDGLEDIEIDDFGGHWLVSTRDRELPAELHHALVHSGRPIYQKSLDPRDQAAPTHLAGPAVLAPFPVREHGLHFEVSFQSGYSQGLFLDQRLNRQRLRATTPSGSRVLNTFAYTGAFSIAAAAAGAVTTTLDLSQPYLDWARRNFRHNHLDPSDHFFCKGDTFHWLRRFARQGRHFDRIILDPPTFSRDDRGRVFRVERDYAALLELAAACLAPAGAILACTNCRKLSETDFIAQLQRAAAGPFELESMPMPPDFTAPPYLKSIWLHHRPHA